MPKPTSPKTPKGPGKQDASFYGGLTFKQFRTVGLSGVEMNDVAWAGRMYPVSAYWFRRLSRVLQALLVLCGASLLVIAVSVYLRPPALLIGVYPDGQMICFSQLVSTTGAPVPVHKSYAELCASLDKRTGRKWTLEGPQKSLAAAAPSPTPPKEVTP